MEAIAIFIAISLPILIALFLPFILSGDRMKAAQKEARARRLTDARMNARLLRLNL